MTAEYPCKQRRLLIMFRSVVVDLNDVHFLLHSLFRVYRVELKECFCKEFSSAVTPCINGQTFSEPDWEKSLVKYVEIRVENCHSSLFTVFLLGKSSKVNMFEI